MSMRISKINSSSLANIVTGTANKARSALCQRHVVTAPPSCTRRLLVSRMYFSSQPCNATDDDTTVQMMLILGKPGGGKGTISEKLLKDFPRFHHVSTGDLLRQHVREQTTLGREAKSYMEKGLLVPDTLMIDVLMSDASTHLEQGNPLLLDGFPRNLTQAVALEEVAQIGLVVNLDVPTETIVERIADRWIHPASGRIYSYSYRPPKVHGFDDVTGEPLIQRPDDQPESVRTRLQAYDTVTAPLVQYYTERGVCKTFTGTKSDVIYPKVKEWLQDQNI